MKFRVATNIGTDCVHRDSQRPGYLRRGFPLQSHSIDSFHVLFFHLDNSPFEFAVLRVIALARCPPYSGRDMTGPWPIPPETYAVLRMKPRAVVPNDAPGDVIPPGDGTQRTEWTD